MHVKEITQAVETASRAFRMAKTFADADVKADLNRMDYVLAEVRHFAFIWDETRTAEDGEHIAAADATKRRQEAISRMIAAVAPGRL